MDREETHGSNSSGEAGSAPKLTDASELTVIFNDKTGNDELKSGKGCSSRATVPLANTEAGVTVTNDLLRRLVSLGIATDRATLGWVGLLISLAGGADQVKHYDYHQTSKTFELSITDPEGTCMSGTSKNKIVKLMGSPWSKSQPTMKRQSAKKWANTTLGNGE